MTFFNRYSCKISDTKLRICVILMLSKPVLTPTAISVIAILRNPTVTDTVNIATWTFSPVEAYIVKLHIKQFIYPN